MTDLKIDLNVVVECKNCGNTLDVDCDLDAHHLWISMKPCKHCISILVEESKDRIQELNSIGRDQEERIREMEDELSNR